MRHWRQVGAVAPDGTFAFAGVPASDCVLVAQEPDDPSAGATVDLSVDWDERVSVILPAGIASHRPAARAISSTCARVTRSRCPASGRARPPSRGWQRRPPGSTRCRRSRVRISWSVSTTVARPGPWGTLLQGTVSARRQTGSSTLLSDVTGVSAPGSTMWSSLLIPLARP